MRREQEGMRLLDSAGQAKQTDEHAVIDEARRDAGAGYNVYDLYCSAYFRYQLTKASLSFSIPVGILYRPSKSKLRNLQARNYLGKARLVAGAYLDTSLKPEVESRSTATDKLDAFTTFTGITKARMKQRKQEQSVRVGPVSTGIDPLSEKGTMAPPSDSRIRRSVSVSAASDVGLSQPTINVASNLRRRPSDYSAAITQGKSSPSAPKPPMPEDQPAPFQQTPSFQRQPSKPKISIKPDLNGPRPLPTPPASDMYEENFAEDLLKSYVTESKSPAASQREELRDTGAPLLQQRTPMGQPKDRIADWAVNASNAAPPPISPTSEYPQTVLSRDSSLRRPDGSVDPFLPNMKPLKIRTKGSIRRSPIDTGSAPDASGSALSWKEVERVRIKLHCDNTIRGMVRGPFNL